MKRIRTENYKYTKIKSGTTQYDDVNLSEEVTVQARYIRSRIPRDNGNRFIEALPPPRSLEDVMHDYQKDLPSYDYEEEVSEPSDVRMNLVYQLHDVRLSLPFDHMLDQAFYEALVSSYRSRYQLSDPDLPIPIEIENRQEYVSRRVIGEDGGTNAGFTLLGYAGCGKSSTMKLLLSRYPQVIIHSNGPNKLCRNPQIVYLLVNCSTHSNFNALYASIGHAIDTALGLTSNTYQDMISKKKGLGEKAAVVQNLIELFAIGIIILDEIQLIDFRSTKENSFEALMTLSNTTKVAFGIIGTEDAYAQMFTKQRTARRVGSPIIASRYCENREFFTFLVRHLFNYQWFDEYCMPTNSLIDALYNDTHGIIDQLIELYIYMHIDYLSARPNERPIIDADFVHRTSKRHYKGLHELTAANTRKFEKELAKKESGTTIIEELGLTLDEENQSKAASELMQQDREKQYAMRVLKKNIMQNVQNNGNYSDLEIMDAMDKVLRVSSNKEKSEEELTALVLRKLNPSARKKSTKKSKEFPSQDSMREYVMGTVPAPQN